MLGDDALQAEVVGGADQGWPVVVHFEVREPSRAGRDARVEAQLLEVVVPVLPGERSQVLVVEDEDVEGE